jgi:hypothetical protein
MPPAANKTLKGVRQVRLQIMLTTEELSAIDDYRFSRRLPNRSTAFRKLLMLAISGRRKRSDSKTNG